MPGRAGPALVFETTRLADERKEFFTRLRVFAEERGWLPARAHELELILEEWLTNILAYGRATKLKAEIQCEADRVRVIVTDNGIPFDPTQQNPPDLGQAPEDRPIGGLGIFMMRKLSDGLSYERKSGQNILMIQKQF